MMRSQGMILLILGLGLVATAAAQEEPVSTENEYAVGFPGVMEDVILPGSVLKSKNIESRDQSIVVRVVNAFAHGDAFRYEFEFYGLEPGTYNLIDYLEREDGSSTEGIPELPVNIVAVLPPGQVEPHQLVSESSFFRNYYLPILIAGGVVWAVGLWMILFWGRGKYRRLDPERHRVTVAQRIQPLVEKAVAGDLTRAEQGELERTLVAFWQKKLRLDHVAPSQMMEKLRANPESGELLQQLENWLHRPDPPENVDVPALMKPYQSMDLNEIEQ